MKNLSVSLVVITLLLFGINSVLAQDQAAKPIFMEGDSWQFNTSRGKVFSTAQTLGITQRSQTIVTNGDQQVAITQQSSSTPNTAASVPAEKRVYVQPHWVDGGYAVQVLQPGYWTVPKKAGEH
jgi:hypothetical protein